MAYRRSDGTWLPGVHAHEMEMYRLAEYDEWADDEDEVDSLPRYFAQQVRGRRPDRGSGPGSNVGDDGDEADDGDVMGDAEVDDDNSGPAGYRPETQALETYERVNNPFTVQDGDDGDIVALARQIAAQRHGPAGYSLEDLPETEQATLLAIAANQAGYAGAYMARSKPDAAANTPALRYRGGPPDALWTANPNKMAERVEQRWRDDQFNQLIEQADQEMAAERINRAAARIARREFGDRALSELSGDELQQCFVRVAQRLGHGASR